MRSRRPPAPLGFPGVPFLFSSAPPPCGRGGQHSPVSDLFSRPSGLRHRRLRPAQYRRHRHRASCSLSYNVLLMELRDALDKARQILDEERRFPTVKYAPQLRPRDTRVPAEQMLAVLERRNALDRLTMLRGNRPREVLEQPGCYRFESANYDLLCALLARLRGGDRASFLHGVLARLSEGPGCGKSGEARFPAWGPLVSEFPLLAEVSIRNGAKAEFFGAVGAAPPLPGHAILLVHLEDMVALNYTVLTDSEYQQLDDGLGHFVQRAAERLRELERRVRGPLKRWPGAGTADEPEVCREILRSGLAVIEASRKARYLHLKNSLLEGLNLEANQDKAAVEGYLREFAFAEPLRASLDEADRLYYERGTPFDLKSSMGHLRSFLENLLGEAVRAVAAKTGDPSWVVGWGAGLAYLRKREILSEAEERFAAALYVLISDEAVHPLVAERECARLARNTVIEEALLLLRKLEKLQIRLPAKAGA
jgi:hypothetical protein